MYNVHLRRGCNFLILGHNPYSDFQQILHVQMFKLGHNVELSLISNKFCEFP